MTTECTYCHGTGRIYAHVQDDTGKPCPRCAPTNQGGAREWLDARLGEPRSLSYFEACVALLDAYAAHLAKLAAERDSLQREKESVVLFNEDLLDRVQQAEAERDKLVGHNEGLGADLLAANIELAGAKRELTHLREALQICLQDLQAIEAEHGYCQSLPYARAALAATSPPGDHFPDGTPRCKLCGAGVEKGECLSCGAPAAVALISFREPTADEIRRGLELKPEAEAALKRNAERRAATGEPPPKEQG